MNPLLSCVMALWTGAVLGGFVVWTWISAAKAEDEIYNIDSELEYYSKMKNEMDEHAKDYE